MQIFVPSETSPGETRIPLLPDTASRLSRKGLEVIVEAGSGDGCGFRDSDYTSAGASIAANRLEALASADILAELERTRPLSVVMAEKIDALRDWASGRAVYADESTDDTAEKVARRAL